MKNYFSIQYIYIIIAILFCNTAFSQTPTLSLNLQLASTVDTTKVTWYSDAALTHVVTSPYSVTPGKYYSVLNASTCPSKPTIVDFVTNTCTTTTINLSTLVDSTNKPSGSIVTYHRGTPATIANQITAAAAQAASTLDTAYYLSYYNTTTSCFTGTSKIIAKNTPCTAVPITLINFTGTVKSCSSKLNWESGVELDFDKYILEYSYDAVKYNTLAQLNGKGSNNLYSFTDQQPLSGTTYYRLKMLEKNNSVSYSPTVMLKVNCKNSNISVFPNPAKNILNINVFNLENNLTSGSNASLFTADGKLLLTQQLVNGNNRINISKYSAGVYILKINTDTKNEISKIIIR